MPAPVLSEWLYCTIVSFHHEAWPLGRLACVNKALRRAVRRQAAFRAYWKHDRTLRGHAGPVGGVAVCVKTKDPDRFPRRASRRPVSSTRVEGRHEPNQTLSD